MIDFLNGPTGSCGNHQGSNFQAHYDPTESIADAIDNKPPINFDALIKPPEENKAVTDLYMSDGDDYYIDDNALSNAQMRTGDDKKADSVVGSGGGGSETNSSVNTGVFGGPARAAHPGYSLW